MCHRLVCPPCAADWGTCGEPSGIALDLGRTARLRAVDSAGRYGLVSSLRGRMRVIDLQQHAWMGSPNWMPACSVLGPEPWGFGLEPRMLSDGRVVYRSQCPADLREGLSVGTIPGAWGDSQGVPRSGFVALGPTGRAARACALWACRSGRAAVVLGSDEALYLADFDRLEVRRFAPSPRFDLVVETGIVDADREIFALATWGKVMVFCLTPDRPELIGSAWVMAGDITWIGLGGDRLAALSTHRRGATLTVVSLSPEGAPGDEVLTWRADRTLPAALPGASRAHPIDISPGGRHVALGLEGGMVKVFDLDAGRSSTLAGHDGRVHFLSFTAAASLISADTRGSVILRPRGEAGHATALQRVTTWEYPLL